MSNSRYRNIVILFEIEVRCPDRTIFFTYFSSQWFLTKFIMTRLFPPRTRTAHFKYFEVNDSIFTATSSILDYINRNVNFRVFGWVKRGIV